jgi:hypothetical protein
MTLQRRAAIAGLVAFGLAGPLAAQEPQASDGGSTAPRVYLDCQGWFCDLDFYRTEITWVNWVRDRKGAQVHLLVTTQTTGGGGREYTLQYIGLEDFAGRQDQLRYVSPAASSEDEERRGLGQVMKLGLVGYAARSVIAPRLQVTFDTPKDQAPSAQKPKDPWNYWVFRLGANGNVNAESRSRSSDVYGSVQATRTTDDWKLRFELEGSRNASHFEFDDGSTYDSKLKSGGASALVVRSLNDHWSAGVNAGARRSDRENLDLELRAAPGIEYNVYPYKESTRRQLTFLYEISLNRYHYVDSTVYNQLTEARAAQSLTVALVTKQPWGSTNLSVQGATYLDDLSKNHVTVFGGMNLRIVKGLQASLFGSFGRVRDQLYLPKEGATDEEVLLRLRQLQTSYRYWVSVGLNYTFGSIFNNIVNPRFGGSDGVMFFF